MKADIYQSITDRIVQAIEAGTSPWVKPWKTVGGAPYSLTSGKPYRGVNVLLLGLEGYADPRWGTYRAITEAGGQVRKGQKATQIVLHKPVPKKEVKEGESSSYWLLRFYSVFNGTQADGLPELPVEETRPFTPIETAEAIVNGYIWREGHGPAVGPPVTYGSNRAAYSVTKDTIQMPDPEMFVSDEAFYTTLFHEMTHSTGGEKRLKRIEPALFGTDPYAQEELVAEIGASFLAGVANFETAGGDESAAYLGGWLKPLKNDKKFIVQAAAKAQKAADLILGTTFEDADGPLVVDQLQAVAA